MCSACEADADHRFPGWRKSRPQQRTHAETTPGPIQRARDAADQPSSNVVRPGAFREPARSYEVEGARLNVSAGTQCAVDCLRCVGLDENGFAVIDGQAGAEIHFCARHAMAAEALISFAGFRGAVVPRLLRLLEQHEDNAIEASKRALAAPAPEQS